MSASFASPGDFIRETYAPLRHGAKLAARDANASPRTAEKWFRKEAEPSWGAMLELARNNPEFRDHLISILEQAS